MVGRRVLVIALACAGCIKLASFRGGGDGGTDASTDGRDGPMPDAAPPGVCGNGNPSEATASMSGASTICAAGPGYALRFPASGFRYPDELRIGSAEVLGASSACNDESRIGIVAYPAPRFSSDTAATGETASATIVAAGPVIAKVAVTWSYTPSSACVPSQNPFSGTSIFTLFPDGRLVRFDKLTQPATANGSNCDCAGSDQYWFVMAYLALDPGSSPVVTDEAGSSYAPSTGFGTVTPKLACVSGAGWGIGIAQVQTGRARTVSSGVLSLTTDFEAGGPMTLTAKSQSAVTAYQIGSAACSDLLPAINQFTSSGGPQLHVHFSAGSDTDIVTQRDGIYGGDNGTSVGLAASGTLTLSATSAAIPGGWALWIHGATIKTPSSNPAQTGDWYRIQNGSGEGVIWFRNGLSASATITVPTQ